MERDNCRFCFVRAISKGIGHSGNKGKLRCMQTEPGRKAQQPSPQMHEREFENTSKHTTVYGKHLSLAAVVPVYSGRLERDD